MWNVANVGKKIKSKGGNVTKNAYFCNRFLPKTEAWVGQTAQADKVLNKNNHIQQERAN